MASTAFIKAKAFLFQPIVAVVVLLASSCHADCAEGEHCCMVENPYVLAEEI